MTPVTILGLGPMGRALARAFIANGNPTTVWNRTPGKAPDGAVEAKTVAEAVGALTIVSVLDYGAVEAIVDAQALRGRTLVNLTADTPHRAREMAAWAADHDITYLEGAVACPAEAIGTPSGTIFYSGPSPVFSRWETELSVPANPIYLGEDPGRAAAFDVAVLDVFWNALAGVVHSYALASAEGIEPGELTPMLKGLGEILPTLIEECGANLESGEHSGAASSIRSTHAQISHVIAASERAGLATGALRAARDYAERATADGRGDEAFSALSAYVAERGK
ncbi:NAD(P)-dependent oxidoreductase [Herbidospora galbida]|uniref:NAD(P)-dependent oxidoreductase n=1 Tax=Herbidospora galbida TaxID=2575442 RepID=A0A4U3M0X3_9ACTN|nr:NAD(P)-binding domain-containing protein [Herbidospora galbida]TKK80906.1 NAD(P)-dependent oxidoreductase [Herbidospora galbida]